MNLLLCDYMKMDTQRIEFHSHKEFEIYCFHKGACKFLIRNKIFTLQPGDIILMNGLTLHRANASPSHQYVRSIMEFSPDFARPVLDALAYPELLDPFYSLNNCLIRLRHPEQLHDFYHSLYQVSLFLKKNQLEENAFNTLTYEHSARLNRLVIAEAKNLLVQTLIHLQRIVRSRMTPVHETKQEMDEHVERLIEYIDLHYTERLTLDSISKALSLDKYYLAHMFKQVTGSTIREYIMYRRLNKAKYLLEYHPEKTIGDITDQSGFVSSAHFSRFFRKKMGVTPSAYRKSMLPTPK